MGLEESVWQCISLCTERISKSCRHIVVSFLCVSVCEQNLNEVIIIFRDLSWMMSFPFILLSLALFGCGLEKKFALTRELANCNRDGATLRECLRKLLRLDRGGMRFYYYCTPELDAVW